MSGIKLPFAKCYVAVHEVAVARGLGEHTIDITLGSHKNENFLGNIYRVKIKETKGTKEISVIVKVAPDDIERDEIPLDLVYSREIFAYTEIFKVFKELEEKNKIPTEKKFPFIECYYTSEDAGKEMLVLEDLQEKGFQRLAKNTPVGLPHITMMVNYLAKYHALSYALKKKDPSKFDELADQAQDYTNEVQNFIRYSEKSLDIAAASCINRVYSSKLMEVKKNFSAKLKMAVKTDEYSVICHSDCYLNNAMFKLENGNPREVMLLDYQFARHGSPAVDLVYMLLSSTDGDMRENHFHNLINTYYATLTETLRAYSIDSRDVLPEEELQRQVKENALFGVVAGVALFKSMSVARYEATRVGRVFGVDQVEPPKGAELNIYRKKVIELVRDCMEYGYI